MYELFPDLVSPCAFELAHACQLAIGQMEAGALVLDQLPDLFASVPKPISQGGAKAAAQTLFEFTAAFAREHHRRFHAEVGLRGCKFDHERYSVHLYVGGPHWDAIDVPRIVRDWVRGYAAAFATSHRSDIAAKARARVLDSARIEQMAREFGCSVTTLRRRVTAAAGEPPIRTRTRARVTEACILLRTTSWKIDAIAAHVGWRSTKDLYRAFRFLLGLTPAEVRTLSADAAADLLLSLGRRSDALNRSAPALADAPKGNRAGATDTRIAVQPRRRRQHSGGRQRACRD